MFWNWLRRTSPAPRPDLRIDGPLRLDPDGESSYPCPCCGDQTRTLVGWVSTPTRTIAAYHFRWIPGRLEEHGATLFLILGRWGDGAEPRHRWAARIEVRWPSGRPESMAVDAEPFPGLADHALSRAEALHPRCRGPMFRVSDVIWAHDPRLEELRAFGV